MPATGLVVDIHLVLIPVFVFFCAIFAASETSLFSLTQAQLESLKEWRPVTFQKIKNLIEKPEQLISTIIIGNECLSILLSTAVVILIEKYLPLSITGTLVLSVLISSFLLLFFAEIFPKVLALKMASVVAPVLVYPMSAFHVLVQPIRKIFLVLSRKILSWFSISGGLEKLVSEKEFLTMVEAAEQSGSLEKSEKELIFNVFNFGDLSLGAVMTPWEKVFTISDENPVEQVLEEVKKKTYSRIPVFSPSKNRVTGVLYTKELIKLLLAPQKIKQNALIDATIEPYFVSVQKKVSKLFRELKAKKIHIALVVDEFGKVVGIVTLEDLLNIIFRTTSKGSVSK